MKSFLEHVLDSVSEKDIRPDSNSFYIFPSRRATYIFKHLIREKFKDQPVFFPSIFSIEDFFVSLSEGSVTDDINLILELYNIYVQFNENTPLEKFYSWGSVIISDFDELDKNLVEPEKLYSNLQDLAELEMLFADDEETLKALKEFTKLFNKEPASNLSKKFLRSWKVMGKIFNEYNHVLNEKHMAYPGMLYRRVIENLTEGKIKNPDKIVFAGFNALTKSEEVLIRSYLEEGNGIVYFDVDRSFMDNEKDEAGHFLRVQRKKWNHKNVFWIEEDMLNDPNKSFKIIGVSQKAAQAKILPEVLKSTELKVTQRDELPNTAVVLADENLLMPVIYSIPDSFSSFNVTMGYPMKNTSAYHLVKSLFQLQLKKRVRKEDTFFNISDIGQLFRNTIIERYFQNEVGKYEYWVSSNRVSRVSLKNLEEMGVKRLLPLLEPHKNGLKFLSHLIDELSSLFYFIKNKEEEENREKIESELMFYAVSSLSSLGDKLSKRVSSLDMEFTERVWNESFQAIKIPFSGEPLSGLQIMGFLETRTLDFENLIVLSVNENKLPASSNTQTFIPFGIRKAFDLHTFKEKDAIYAYHFKRSLQRAKNVFMVYDTEVAVDGSGEQSRYLKQILYNNSIGKIAGSVSEKTVLNGAAVLDENADKISIQKDEKVLDQLKKFTVDGNRLLSPTRLSEYIECKLRFYLKHVAGIPEEEGDPGNLDPALFGNVFHIALELLYKPYLGKVVNQEAIDKMGEVSNVESKVTESLEINKLINKHKSVEGREQLLIKIISKTISMILKSEQRIEDFIVEGIEERIEKEIKINNGVTVKLGGVVDRLDEIESDDGNILRVVDYKTGKVEIQQTKGKTDEEYINNYFTEPKFKSGFQVYNYLWLLREIRNQKNFKSGIYSIRSLSNGMMTIRGGNLISSDLLDYYGGKIMELINEIYDPSIPFDQTTDLDRCRYCSFKTICNRHN